MYCKYCKNPISNDARFCEICGKEQIEKSPVQEKPAFCKFCGNPISDDAKFCGKCGKEQDSTPDGGTGSLLEQMYKEQMYNKDPKAGIFNFLAICLNIVLIILTFTSLFTINIGSSYYSKSIEISMFSFFDGSDFISALSISSSGMEDFQAVLILGGVTFLLASLICICYLLFYISRFSFLHSNPDYSNYCRFSMEVRKYNTLAAFIFIFVSIITLIIISCSIPEGMSNYVSVSPSPALIAIYIMTGIQWLINRFN